MCKCLKEEELTKLLHRQLLDVDSGDDWTVRHGRSTALFVGVKEAPERLLTNEHELKVVKAARSITSSDRIPLRMAGLRCAGYILTYQLSQGQALHMDLISD